MWVPHYSDLSQPVYLMIADALEQDIGSGRLAAGDRLPTLKDLAEALSVTPGTIGRAYDEAAKRGLVVGEVGRGTFVLQRQSATPTPALQTVPAAQKGDSSQVDLSIIKPNDAHMADWLRGAINALADAPDLAQVLDYVTEGGHATHKQAGAAWIQRWLPEARWQQVVLTSGAQHGLLVAISSLSKSDDVILCESFCYPGIISLAHSMGRRLRGVAMDEHGLIPEALRAACREHRPALLVCVATHQNPTNSIMPRERREAIAQIAREFDLFIIDDDIYGFLEPNPEYEPLAAYAPERSVYLTSLSKSVLPALRIGYLYAPPQTLSRLSSMVRSSVWMPSPLMAQLASNLINSGKADQLIQVQQSEAAARQQMAREILGQYNIRSQPNSFHIWLELPEPWTSDEFANLARNNGVTVVSGSQFLPERTSATCGVRIALMTPSRQELSFALTKLASLLDSPEPRLFY
ncbi:PLP-dependent aminotransferase family protein [Pseudomonas sp. SWI6]|uniref:PLP-dependent aminotransferase family protein n=1 Tax=Pseudomonas taiwanensis TaxID=470150 RepID=A0ABR6VD51_9PSED|nr:MULTISPECIES: PLP-dependent aminotransferase family protein [Pseudomonas]AVD81354.1 PLP-dependent aminotransferase family protein [Pseudomonas sp. SWI6]MBC3478458.1 PLP-dependent aminotransferase family protein [Pseudomonas taiwanensis]MBC3493150.1 PLP-dependent aminotransferase family protein [Pseudomonas taiwanensis]MPT01014.1 PLP-dependent aminotransferase family protein [Pseudomonas sp.]QQZ35813.1 PLP-dependent aminotransferase family protein [Pseudomonas sp. SK2]